jgi:AraC-like DNA-binding protein
MEVNPIYIALDDLEYSSSSFHRSFKRWKGITPGEFIRKENY